MSASHGGGHHGHQQPHHVIKEITNNANNANNDHGQHGHHQQQQQQQQSQQQQHHNTKFVLNNKFQVPYNQHWAYANTSSNNESNSIDKLPLSLPNIPSLIGGQHHAIHMQGGSSSGTSGFIQFSQFQPESATSKQHILAGWEDGASGGHHSSAPSSPESSSNSSATNTNNSSNQYQIQHGGYAQPQSQPQQQHQQQPSHYSTPNSSPNTYAGVATASSQGYSTSTSNATAFGHALSDDNERESKRKTSFKSVPTSGGSGGNEPVQQQQQQFAINYQHVYQQPQQQQQQQQQQQHQLHHEASQPSKKIKQTTTSAAAADLSTSFFNTPPPTMFETDRVSSLNSFSTLRALTHGESAPAPSLSMSLPASPIHHHHHHLHGVSPIMRPLSPDSGSSLLALQHHQPVHQQHQHQQQHLPQQPPALAMYHHHHNTAQSNSGGHMSHTHYSAPSSPNHHPISLPLLLTASQSLPGTPTRSASMADLSTSSSMLVSPIHHTHHTVCSCLAAKHVKPNGAEPGSKPGSPGSSNNTVECEEFNVPLEYFEEWMETEGKLSGVTYIKSGGKVIGAHADRKTLNLKSEYEKPRNGVGIRKTKRELLWTQKYVCSRAGAPKKKPSAAAAAAALASSDEEGKDSTSTSSPVSTASTPRKKSVSKKCGCQSRIVISVYADDKSLAVVRKIADHSSHMTPQQLELIKLNQHRHFCLVHQGSLLPHHHHHLSQPSSSSSSSSHHINVVHNIINHSNTNNNHHNVNNNNNNNNIHTSSDNIHYFQTSYQQHQQQQQQQHMVESFHSPPLMAQQHQHQHAQHQHQQQQQSPVTFTTNPPNFGHHQHQHQQQQHHTMVKKEQLSISDPIHYPPRFNLNSN
ncbi:hypothetical protein SAMD00019534_116530 [Acytostelium subglobosum LB1]|uniref:hypothetical protein n=1 Tax=Acytostelium subglobosum LB1 TaxID=1410327 RepID=UPI000644CFE5|nr:hypothetical protein SAMD00019534_116530 [Acytostelium subglobosum LB1]GAM28477.1 hypothetical protein SAMD00019534_116530 [Acytostelium subglobosum LB1]|eukprot:XP_012748516.1 hypothetical protein SAMD00019534_116530 [Acytostelium subglobosum LB1]